MFESVEDVKLRLREQGYICGKNIATVVYLATQLEKPVLVEGPAGVGKTELAKVVAAATGRNLIRLQCYEGLDEAKAPWRVQPVCAMRPRGWLRRTAYSSRIASSWRVRFSGRSRRRS